MTEGQDQEPPAEVSALPPKTGAVLGEGAKSAQPGGGSRRTVWWLAALLLLMIAGIGLSPFWAPNVAPLLPWTTQTAAPIEALAARLDAIEKRAALPSPDLGAINSAVDALTRRVDQLETARNTDRQTDAAVGAMKAELQQLEERLSALEARSASRASSETAEFEKSRQELAKIGSISTDLADRVSGIERRVGAAGTARTNGALFAALLQMREVVEAARPFAAEYNAFIALSHDQPDLIAAAHPLAGVAGAGVASYAVLSERLGNLSGRTLPAVESPVSSGLGEQAWAWLHSLVTIRRIDAAAQTGQEPAMSVAEAALARGDLSGAVSALQTLSGSNSSAIQSWLEMARQRLAAEAALAHLQRLLVAHLGAPAEVPRDAPTEAPAKSAQPS
ncbi:MAG: hypothetical protein JO282_15600 [Alphaproteobacteria bacterium]|nr:hypothetical protein [Alphaproteobacteria bacterium]